MDALKMSQSAQTSVVPPATIFIQYVEQNLIFFFKKKTKKNIRNVVR